MKSKSIICKRSSKNGGWLISDETRNHHLSLNNKIRKSRKPIPLKPDLDVLMEDSLNNKIKDIRAYTLYTDGGCDPNPGEGAWAFCLVENGKIIQEHSGFEEKTTNNRMECLAIIKSLELIIEKNISATIYSDSELIVKTYNLWMKKWHKNGWYRDKKKLLEVKNLDLIQRLFELKLNIKNSVSVEWIRGHNGNAFNEYVDSLCTKEIMKNYVPSYKKERDLTT